MWAEVVEVARIESVETTARVLQLDPARLAARMTGAGTAAGEMSDEVRGGFVELDAGRLGLAPRRNGRLSIGGCGCRNRVRRSEAQGEERAAV